MLTSTTRFVISVWRIKTIPRSVWNLVFSVLGKFLTVVIASSLAIAGKQRVSLLLFAYNGIWSITSICSSWFLSYTVFERRVAAGTFGMNIVFVLTTLGVLDTDPKTPYKGTSMTQMEVGMFIGVAFIGSLCIVSNFNDLINFRASGTKGLVYQVFNLLSSLTSWIPLTSRSTNTEIENVIVGIASTLIILDTVQGGLIATMNTTESLSAQHHRKVGSRSESSSESHRDSEFAESSDSGSVDNFM